ncbi:unnamed protein product [Adineta ricciae]|uniref:Uncharacterized protein n=1 Tax=Adineta ricciae TaxID=249248 RepID=A0A816BPQ4_ADIRI|nr:unnamed protein product [Adineta ricciae]
MNGKVIDSPFKLRSKHSSLDMLISSSQQSRKFYRISKETLRKYHSKHNDAHLHQNETSISITEVSTTEALSTEQKSTTTHSNQTPFDALLDDSELSHIDDSDELTNTFPSSINQFNSSCDSDTIQKHESNDCSSNLQSNCRVRIRAIMQHMLSDDSDGSSLT